MARQLTQKKEELRKTAQQQPCSKSDYKTHAGELESTSSMELR